MNPAHPHTRTQDRPEVPRGPALGAAVRFRRGPAGLTSVTAIAAGYFHSLALGRSGDQASTIDGFFGPVHITCTAAANSGEEVVFTTTGNTALRYTDGKFQQNWKTPKTTGCYQITLTTHNTSLTATFLLR